MRRLVICCDGTWNTPDQDEGGIPVPTNVVRLYNTLAELDDQGQPQLSYYHPGVGTEGSWWEKTKGGSVGEGLSKNILSAWHWLCAHVRDGDRLYFFGFSRGAYTVRSLAGLMATCGLPDLGGLSEAQQWTRLETAFSSGYREGRPRESWGAGWPFLRTPEDLRIDFLGVWDTVGALGIPDNLAILNLMDSRRKHAFHNTALSPKVLQARHAVALDEWRASFAPTLWTAPEGHGGLRQVWFPGVHCDVGGGYAECGLSDGALLWMIEEARSQGLAFKQRMVSQIRPDHQGVLHDSCSGVFKLLRTQPRSTPATDATAGDQHDSSLRRMEDPPIFQAPYRSTRKLALGESCSLEVYAADRWNITGLWLEAGATYEFKAAGQWLNRDMACGPGGTSDGHFDKSELIHVAAGLWGRFEELVKKVTGNEEADFYGSSRVEGEPWMALMGAIANGGNPGSDGTPAPLETFRIGTGTQRAPRGAGYLYCYANDAWNFYRNNRGSVQLDVMRMS